MVQKKLDLRRTEKWLQKKDILARGLKRSDAQDRAVWRIGCKNRPTRASGENKLGPKNTKLIVKTSGTNDDILLPLQFFKTN